MCQETECAIVAAFFSIFLLLQYNHCNTGPLSVSSMLLSSPVTILRQLSPLHTVKYKGNYHMYLPNVQFRVLVCCSIRL